MWRLVDADHHYACDRLWWDMYYDEVKANYPGISHTINDLDHPKRNPKTEYDLIRHNSKHGDGLSKDFIHYGVNGGGNSGFQAVNLAYHMGAQTILLLGFDMCGEHFFGKHPRGLCNGSPFPKFIKSFESIEQDVEIINCTRISALTCFPKMSLESALSSVAVPA